MCIPLPLLGGGGSNEGGCRGVGLIYIPLPNIIADQVNGDRHKLAFREIHLIALFRRREPGLIPQDSFQQPFLFWRQRGSNKFTELNFVCPVTIAEDFLDRIFCSQTKPCDCQSLNFRLD